MFLYLFVASDSRFTGEAKVFLLCSTFLIYNTRFLRFTGWIILLFERLPALFPPSSIHFTSKKLRRPILVLRVSRRIYLDRHVYPELLPLSFTLIVRHGLFFNFFKYFILFSRALRDTKCQNGRETLKILIRCRESMHI
mgnify:CR=1 FL=1